jgi:NAD(P)-dependent dehydrogenase (short-subunit alcohol dehydrogenase family)
MKIAVVTGAGSGIGREVTLALHRAGWAVTLAGRRAAALEETVRLAGTRDRLLPFPADITDASQVEALFARSQQHFGRIDLLFNNAGIGAPPLPLDELPVETWRAVVEVNLTGAFLCARQAMAWMKRQSPRGGRIINNGSVAAYAPRPHSAPYTATKHAITGLTKSISLDGRAWDIACGQIDIGNAATDMTAPMAAGALQADGSVRPEPRMELRHVGDAVVYMASLPLEANVQFLTVMATKMPLVGRG